MPVFHHSGEQTQWEQDASCLGELGLCYFEFLPLLHIPVLDKFAGGKHLLSVYFCTSEELFTFARLRSPLLSTYL